MTAWFGSAKFQGNEYRTDIKDQFPGIYRAIVEYTLDPIKRGRVKVRIPSMHGIPSQTETYLKTIELPWAEPCHLFSGPDMGQFVVPLAGSTVYIMFEAGDPNKPVYIGAVHGVKLTEGKPMGVIGGVPPENEVSGGHWTSSLNDEVPLDVFDGISKVNPDPSRSVPFKSRKGHTVLFDDTDGKESLSIIDRIGQVLGFVSPVILSANNTGDQSFQRGLSNARNKTQFSLDKLVNNMAVFFIRDVGQQILRFVTQLGKERAQFVSNAQSNGNNSQAGLDLQAATGSSTLFYQDSTNSNRASVKVTDSSIEFSIMSGGSVVGSLIFNANGLSVTGNLEATGQLVSAGGIPGLTANDPDSGDLLQYSPNTVSVTTSDTLWVDNFDENFIQ